MKTTKLFLSIALVALTVISFGKTNLTDKDASVRLVEARFRKLIIFFQNGTTS